MSTTNGSTTFFRGMPDAVTENHEIIFNLPLKAGETVYKGQALIYDQDTNQETSPVAGVNENGSTNGTVRAMTDGDSYADVIVGICLKNIDDSDTSANEYGDHIVPILIRGQTLMRYVVNDTDGSDGYDIPFGCGSLCAIGGGAGGGTLTGSNTVTGFTALEPGAYVMCPTSATDGSSNSVIGWFLDFQDGSTTTDSISDNTATIAASQAESPSSWVKVYVDMTAVWAGGTMVKWTV